LVDGTSNLPFKPLNKHSLEGTACVRTEPPGDLRWERSAAFFSVLPIKSRRDGLRVAQDVVLGSGKQAGQSREGRLNTGAEFQSSLRDYSMAHS
jgi:hypothetical protein